MSESPADFEQEQEALRVKVFTAVAHDLRTPLACIIGSLETFEQMGESLTDSQRLSLIKAALVEAQRLDSFIATMLDKVKP